ncbi:hypothetical protein AV530_017490 [Patagioenas fasciata monilis]|uniref:Uncharacterized protein n=1 Tax=Patagioenas fasciata monilis TaxID=372326 RepID=A0A1V4JGG3_PATFA|nr:hypothetical protein AV530_017490 [Patagioenas fasciata monilis]
MPFETRTLSGTFQMWESGERNMSCPCGCRLSKDKNIHVKEPIVKEEGKKVIHNRCLLCRHFNRIDASQQLMIRVVF